MIPGSEDGPIAIEHLEIIGHRGFSARAPENTLAAVRAALEAGADAVEWDLNVAACGTPVLIHDSHLSRTTDGSGKVAESTFRELRKLDAGSWFGADFAGERIPGFAEALEEVRPFGATIYAEVKAYRELEDLDRMARLVREMGVAERTAFISLDFGIADRLARREPTARIGYVVDKHQRFQDALGRARKLRGRGLVDFSHRLLLEDPDLVPRARAQGVDVAVWTVDTVEVAEALHAVGVRRFTTNEVRTLVEWRRRRDAGSPLPHSGSVS